MAQQPPLIVLPGITGTTLEDMYPVGPEEVWGTILHKEYDRIALPPDEVGPRRKRWISGMWLKPSIGKWNATIS